MTRPDHRGASEVVSFVLVFAVVFAGVGVVQTAGLDTLGNVRDQHRTDSAERAFLTLSGSIDDVRRGAPGRSGTLRLGSGRLVVEAGPAVTVDDGGGNRTFGTGTLSYRVDSTSVSYASGGVFRADRDGSVVLREPATACRRGPANATIVSVVAFHSRRGGIDTDGPASVVLRTVDTATWEVDQVELNVSTTRNGPAWGRYLVRNGWTETAPSTYACGGNRTYVRRTTVDVRFVA